MSDYFVSAAGGAINNPEFQDQITTNNRQYQVKKQAEELLLSARRGTREIEINITEAIDKIQMLRESLTEYQLQAKLDVLISQLEQHPTGEKMKIHDVAFMIEQAFQSNTTSEQVFLGQAAQATLSPEIRKQSNAGKVNIVESGMLPSELYNALAGSRDASQNIAQSRVTGPAPKQRRSPVKKKKQKDDPTTFDRVLGFLFGEKRDNQ